MKSKIYFFTAILILAAVFTGCNKETYTVTFNPNGGTGTMQPQTFTEGEAQALNRNAFTYDGYTFTGWNTVQSGSGISYPDGQTITATMDMILYAQWTGSGTSGGGQQGGETPTPTPPSPEGSPTVETGSAEVTVTDVILSGNVTDVGDAPVTACGFMYGISINDLNQSVQSGSGSGSFTATITDLAFGTNYYYKAYAINSKGTAYGDVMSFTTVEALTVQTNAASSITMTEANLNGKVILYDGAPVTARGFLYGISPSDLSQSVQGGSGTGNYTKVITGLSSGTTYYYKAYATNSSGTSYGEIVSFTTNGTLNGHEWVDLGLPSGIKWATCNVGASTPTAYGNYYAWGETTTKSSYTQDNYTYSSNPTTLPSSADAATANWGSNWRMPKQVEMEELYNSCTHEWTTQNGVMGRKFTGSNGNSIFLPAAGYRNGSSRYNAGSSGYYRSSTDPAWSLRFYSGGCGLLLDHRYYGHSVRAVCQP